MNTSELLKVTERKVQISAAHPAPHTPVRAAAEALSRRNIAGAKAELLSEALWALVALCYEADGSGQWCNVDSVSGRLLLPAPMGREGHRRWGLRYTESVLLRRIVRGHEQAGGEPPLLVYDPPSRGWYLNFFDYPTHEAALAWLHRHPITASTWRSAYAAWAGGEEGSE